jgi:hypothetical protein
MVPVLGELAALLFLFAFQQDNEAGTAPNLNVAVSG